jgi:hypothetical protein
MLQIKVEVIKGEANQCKLVVRQAAEGSHEVTQVFDIVDMSASQDMLKTAVAGMLGSEGEGTKKDVIKSRRAL